MTDEKKKPAEELPGFNFLFYPNEDGKWEPCNGFDNLMETARTFRCVPYTELAAYVIKVRQELAGRLLTGGVCRKQLGRW